MIATRRLTIDAVLQMAIATAQKHCDALPTDGEDRSDLTSAVGATWGLVKRRLGASESAVLDALITKIVGTHGVAGSVSSVH